MLNCFGIDKLHGFMIHSVILAVHRISGENDYSLQFSNVGRYMSLYYRYYNCCIMVVTITILLLLQSL